MHIISFSFSSSHRIDTFKRVFFLLLIFFQITNLFAQEIEWQNTIGGSGGDEFVYIIQSNDGGFLVGGNSWSPISGDKTEGGNIDDYWILKIDSVGFIEWQNTIRGSDTDLLKSIIQTNDGGYLLGGFSNSENGIDKTEMCMGLHDYWLVKTDSLGTIQWDNTIGGNFEDKLVSVIQTPDGGFLIGGSSNSDSSADKSEDSYYFDYWIVKTDSNGIIQWENSIMGYSNDYLSSILSTSDGGYVLGGYSMSNISFDKTENSNGGYDYWVVKIDSAGNIIWQNTIGGSGNDFLNSIIQSTDGGYLCAGNSNSGISGDKTENSNGSADYWIVKIDSIGSVQWQNTIGGSSWDSLSSVIQTSDGGYFIGGFSHSGISGDKDEALNGKADFWVIKTDSMGVPLWQNTIGGNKDDELFSVISTKDGGMALSGWSTSDISDDKSENCLGVSDYWIVKLTDNNNLITGKTFADINGDMMQGLGEFAIPYQKITELNSNRFGFSHPSGNYYISLPDTGNFEVIPDFLNYYNPMPLIHTGNFTSILQIDSLNDFAHQPTTIFNDLCLTITPTSSFRSGFNASYRLNYINQGTTTLIPTIVFYPDDNVSFVSASVVPTFVTPDSVVFAFNSLSPYQSGQISIVVNVNSGLSIGTLINSSAMILPIINDANPGCNSSYWEVFTIGSMDPNDILVNRAFIYDTEIQNEPELEYIIRFQNTGNDTAFTVKVLNPIDTTRLQLNSFQIVSSSHPMQVSWVAWERNMQFEFENILLPDSNVNEPQSHGFIRYKIKPKLNLLVGDTIFNQAHIYFDFNNPVATNIASTDIILFTGVQELQVATEILNIYPNPATTKLTIQFNPGVQKEFSLELFNVYGQKIKVIHETNVSGNNFIKSIDISDLASGIYFVNIQGAGGSVKKFVKY